MAESEDPKPSIAFHEVLPSELTIKIFQELDLVSIYQARDVCKGWRAIIDDFQLAKSERNHAVAVSTNIGTFLFGGSKWENRYTYEYLPKDSNIWQWQDGKTHIPQGFNIDEIGYTTAVSVKSNEIWLVNGEEDLVEMSDTHWNSWNMPNDELDFHINFERIHDIEYGSYMRKKRAYKGSVYCFNPETHTFKSLAIVFSSTRSKRSGHRCAMIPGSNKLMVTGGIMDKMAKSGTDIIDIDDRTVTSGSPLSHERAYHGIGIMTVDNKDRIAVFGGSDENDEMIDSVEIYDAVKDEWEISNIKLDQIRDSFSFLSLSNYLVRNYNKF